MSARWCRSLETQPCLPQSTEVQDQLRQPLQLCLSKLVDVMHTPRFTMYT